ncbi:MAG: PKD domain-containing protein [Bacteroidia bacterium]
MKQNKTSTCDSFKLFSFKAKSDSAATFFWNFGDGTTATGDSVTKMFPKLDPIF